MGHAEESSRVNWSLGAFIHATECDDCRIFHEPIHFPLNFMNRILGKSKTDGYIRVITVSIQELS